MKSIFGLALITLFSLSTRAQECLVDTITKDGTHFKFITAYEGVLKDPYAFSDAAYADGISTITARIRFSLIFLGKKNDCKVCMDNYGFLLHIEMHRSDMPYFRLRPDAIEFITADKESHTVQGNLSGAMADTDHLFWEVPGATSSIEFIFPVTTDSDYELYKTLVTQSIREIKVMDQTTRRFIPISPKDKMSLSDALLCQTAELEAANEGNSKLYAFKNEVDDIQFAITTGMALFYDTESMSGTGTQIPPETEIQILDWPSDKVARVSWEDTEGYVSAANIK